MVSPPKTLLGLGAIVMTLRATQRWRRRGGAQAEQESTFRHLLARQSQTSFGREHGLQPGWGYREFQQRVVPRTYPQLTPYLQRLRQGEADVLWPGLCPHFAITAGTTELRPKTLPFTRELRAHVQAAALETLLLYSSRVGHTRVFRGRHLLLVGSTAPAQNGGTPASGDATGLAAASLPPTFAKHFYEPGAVLAAMADGAAKWTAIADRVRGSDLSLVAGQPHALLRLAEALFPATDSRAQRPPGWNTLWGKLECIVHGGTALAPYADELRQAVGPRARFQEVYHAAEGFIAAQDTDAPGDLRLLTAAGLFFEFIPLTDYHEGRLPSLGGKAVPLSGVQAGKDYVLLLTTPAGLCRYVLGDVVRILSADPPRIRYLGRTQLQLNCVGEHLWEADVTHALVATCQRQSWRIVNYHVAPLVLPAINGEPARPRHEWWIELKPGTMATPTGPTLAVDLDAELQRLSESYRIRRRDGSLEAPVVRLVMPGLFEQWLRAGNKAGPQQKVPRCRNDRLVADELAHHAPFSAH